MKKPEDSILRKVEAVIIHDGRSRSSWKTTFLAVLSLHISNPKIRTVVLDISEDQSFKTRWDDMVKKMEGLGYKKRRDSYTPIHVRKGLKSLNIFAPYVMRVHPDLLFLRDLTDEVKELVDSDAKAMCSDGFLLFRYNPERDVIGESETLLEHGKVLEKNLTAFWKDEKITNETAFVHSCFDHKKGHDGRGAEAKREWVQKRIEEMMEEFDYINSLTEENVYLYSEEA